MSETNHYELLKKYLKRGYRSALKDSTGASISTINKVIRGQMKDNYGIIVVLYKIANEELERQVNDANKLASLKRKINKNNIQ